jgi:murein DD-endopeptidase MepM/ murein hydrolase activator NlpD
MNTGLMDFSYQMLAARLKVLEDKVARLEGNAPAMGQQGTMTTKEETIEGWVTPNTSYGANIREWASTSDHNPPLYCLEYGDTLPVEGRASDAEGKINPATGKPYVWYMVRDGDDNFVREDVVTFSKDKPAPLIPIKSALWPAPVTGYTITTRHGEHGHDGVDLACADGMVVRCGPNGGYVSVAKHCDDCDPHGTPGVRIASNNYGFGTHVVIRYAFDLLPPPLQALIPVGAFLFTMHAHLSMIATVLTPGMTLDPYQKIGEVGSTGDSSGPHLHFAAHWSLDPHADFYVIRANAIDPKLLVKA